MRIVFMGTPEFAVPSLEQLLINGYQVEAVYTQPDRPAGRGRTLVPSPVKKVALHWGLPVEQPASLKSPEAVARLAAYSPEVVVVAAYGQILTPATLGVPARGTVNVHASLLPRYRGAAPVVAALLAGDEITGVTILLVEPRLDAGPVLASAAVTISPHDNTGTLAAKLSRVGANLLQEALSGWWRGDIKPRPQDEAEATYFPRIGKEAGWIDWSLPAVDVGRRVRAFNPWPGCYTRWRGKQLKIIEAVALPGEVSAEIGRVVALEGCGAVLGVGTGAGVLGVIKLQLEGKRAVAAADFLKGQRDFIGSVLPG